MPIKGEGESTMEGMSPGLTDLDLWSALVGIGMPPLVAVAISSRWQPWQRALVAAALCMLAGVGTTWIAGDLAGVTPVRAVLLVAMAAFGSYSTWWKGSGITQKIEEATTPRPGRKRRRRPKPLKAGQGPARPLTQPRPAEPAPWISPPPGSEWQP
jgi:hypothetical protein